ncbi:MAG: EAL domain-containing protein [Rhizobiales bacterium]|nr:EAL domain-containing protein [Hyphomicrobiales bacterium]
MLPISAIVAVAIVCIIAAALTSAQRADEVALNHEKRLFAKSITNHGERVLRELESIAVSERAVRSIRLSFDSVAVHQRIGLWLKTFFDHDFVFVADSSGGLVYALLGRNSVDPSWFNSVLPDLKPVLDYTRTGKLPANAAPVAQTKSAASSGSGPRLRSALVQKFMDRPAVVAAAMIVPFESDTQEQDTHTAPTVISVKFIDDEVLGEIAFRLQLANLRQVAAQPTGKDDFSFDIFDYQGHPIVRFAWTPKRPGAEIVQSVTPFIAIALAGFALLAALIFGYMRRSAETIAAGEKRLRYLALHDPLCGLPNRNLFGERLENAIGEVHRDGGTAAVFYIDLDHFKDVNDTLGHHIGDELIRNVTLRLTSALREDDIVARLGGDEFAVLTHTSPDQAHLNTIANRIIATLCAPYSISDHTIVIGASIGIAVIDSRAGVAADIMRYADMALYRAKNEGRNRACIYDAAMDADLSHRKLLENDLREAIENDELRLLYQPIVNASGEKTIGIEALARWYHPVHGDIPPADFIPIAEHSGLIIQLGDWVLRRACLDGDAWPGLTIAVNVSPLQFRRADFVDVVERILSETEFNPTRLELELTESTLLGNVDSAESAMHRLKASGVRLALDDFGTGYSSLAYLRRFPFDKLKVDRSFVRSVEKAADAAAVVHAIVSLGRGLGMKVTAEGVENAQQQLFLRAAGVHFMQGYRFGMPMTAEEITARLAKPGTYRSIENDAAAAIAG